MSHSSQGHIDVLAIVEDQEYLPIYMTEGAAGADLKAHLAEPVILPPGQCKAIPTGLRLAIPHGYEIQVRPRSGLARKHQITVLNTPGTIDADYRGEIEVILINHGDLPFMVTPGMRIAQIILAPVLRANFIVAEELSLTRRGEGGFGHTG